MARGEETRHLRHGLHRSTIRQSPIVRSVNSRSCLTRRVIPYAPGSSTFLRTTCATAPVCISGLRRVVISVRTFTCTAPRPGCARSATLPDIPLTRTKSLASRMQLQCTLAWPMRARPPEQPKRLSARDWAHARQSPALHSSLRIRKAPSVALKWLPAGTRTAQHGIGGLGPRSLLSSREAIPTRLSCIWRRWRKLGASTQTTSRSGVQSIRGHRSASVALPAADTTQLLPGPSVKRWCTGYLASS